MRGDLSGGAVMDILVWLPSLGLGKYEATFRENKVDETVLGPSEPHGGLKLLNAIIARRFVTCPLLPD